MPHEPGHTVNNYVIVGTNEPYSGRVVFIGSTPYSTTSGVFEGVPFSQELKIISQNPVIENDQQITSNESQDVVTIFVVTNNPQNEFYVEGFSNMNGGYYYDQKGNDRVPTGTKLHHHTNPAQGDNNFMTQHSMDGGAVNVFTFNQTRQFLQDNPIEMLPSAGTSVGGTTSGGMTSGMSGGGRSVRGTGGGGGGGY